MYKKKEVIITFLLVLVLPFVITGNTRAKVYCNGGNVDAIYQSIRNSEPAYEWDESIITFENDGMTMFCSLTIPRSQHLVPIVITLAGFMGTRDGDPIPGANELSFKRISRILAEQGIASLRVDYRGSGDSDGEYQMTTFSTQVSDVMASLDYITTMLKHQVNWKSIGIIGISQGGLVGSTVAARDNRVDSLVLWSSVVHPPITYEGLLLKEGIQQGLALPDGGYDMFGLYINGQYLGFDVPLGKGFFEELFSVHPLAEICKYRKPLMAVVGTNDIIVWPQPAVSETFLKYHSGVEKLVVLDADHSLNYWEGPVPEKYDDAIYWSTAWFIKTLKVK